MALMLTITTGKVDPERIEAFQVTFRTLLERRVEEVPYLRQALLVHLGDSEWQMLTLWDSALAQVHAPDSDVPLTVRIFRDFGADPEIRLAEVSSLLLPGRGAPKEPLAEPTVDRGASDREADCG